MFKLEGEGECKNDLLLLMNSPVERDDGQREDGANDDESFDVGTPLAPNSSEHPLVRHVRPQCEGGDDEGGEEVTEREREEEDVGDTL